MNKMSFTPRLILIGCALILLVACQPPAVKHYTTVKTQPAGALQLDPGIFLSADSMVALKLELGDVADVVLDDQVFQANVYPYVYAAGELGMNRFMLARLGETRGAHNVFVAKAKQPLIPVQKLKMHGEAYPGDVAKWGHFVISAPHGDCDLFTGEIVKAMNAQYDFPTTAFYYPRFTFLGRWYDANRPLGKAPRADGHWTIPERIWTPEIDSVYHSYEDIIRQTAEVAPGQPLDFLCSFHGHDLKMKDATGTKINREVIEAYGSGFTQAEYHLMVKWFNEISSKYFKSTPKLVFGNLPEDQKYEIKGQTFRFWYTGLGTRTYGTLKKSNTTRGLHMETPNSLRFDPQVRFKTAQMFGEFFVRIHDQLLQPLAPALVDSSDHRPAVKQVTLDSTTFKYRGRELAVKTFRMSCTEVSVINFADFLQARLGTGTYHLDADQRKITNDQGELICRLDAFHPGDMLAIRAGYVQPAPGRQYYPMTHVSWIAATDYADYVGGRLPTEAEWVRAAGFWDGKLHAYAVSNKDYADLSRQINFDGSEDVNLGTTYPQALPCGSLTPNQNGLYEMSGNIWEWCSDWYNSKTFRKLPQDTVSVNPQGPETGTMRTMKGGSWAAGLDVTKVRYRVALAPGLSLAELGFRVVWDE